MGTRRSRNLPGIVDYSAEDSQGLIREYTTLFHELIREFELVVAENEGLRAQLQAWKAKAETHEDEPPRIQRRSAAMPNSVQGILHLARAFTRSLRENGWETTTKKVISRIARALDGLGE